MKPEKNNEDRFLINQTLKDKTKVKNQFKKNQMLKDLI